MRRRREQVAISLFPFLSILACVIGTLTLLIAGMVAGDTAPTLLASEPSRAQPALEPEPEQLEQDPAGDELGDALPVPRGGVDTPAGTDSPGAADQHGGDQAIGGELIDDPGEAPGAAPVQSGLYPLGEGELTPRPSGEGLRLPLVVDYFDPRDAQRYRVGFVLCDELGIVIDVQESDGPRERVPSNVVGSSPELADYLRRFGRSSRGIVVFLIRPGGVPNFERAQEVARRERVGYGQLPVPAGRQLDFSRLEAHAAGMLPGGEPR